MKLSLINESDNIYSFKLKDGREGVIKTKHDKRVNYPSLGSIKMQVTVDGEPAGEFILGFWVEGGATIMMAGKPKNIPKRLIAQMDVAKVPDSFRRQGIASAVYDLAEKLASNYGATLEQTHDSSQDAQEFWRSRQG